MPINVRLPDGRIVKASALQPVSAEEEAEFMANSAPLATLSLEDEAHYLAMAPPTPTKRKASPPDQPTTSKGKGRSKGKGVNASPSTVAMAE